MRHNYYFLPEGSAIYVWYAEPITTSTNNTQSSQLDSILSIPSRLGLEEKN